MLLTAKKLQRMIQNAKIAHSIVGGQSRTLQIMWTLNCNNIRDIIDILCLEFLSNWYLQVRKHGQIPSQVYISHI